MSKLSHYVVLYRDDNIKPCDMPLAFTCQAENTDHAEEQCENANPDCDIVWVVETNKINIAFDEYYDVGVDIVRKEET